MLLLSATILGFFLRLTICYCPIPDNAMENLVHFADIVVVGKVTEIIPDPAYSTYEETTYCAKVDVRCSYKGALFPRKLPKTITIGEAGESNVLL